MHNYPKVTIGLILYKVNPHLKDSLTSLMEQDYPNIEYLLRDQSPNGEAHNFIHKELPDVYDRVIVEKGDNLMHSGGHNTLIRKMKGEYYFCVSNDMLYPPNLVSTVIKEMEKHEHQKYGSATCKLMVWDFPLRHHDYPEIDTTNTIDSCGLGLKKNHFFYDLGQGEEDKHQYDHKRSIFGASGALAIYRKKALKDISFTHQKSPIKNHQYREYFDELLHYKNDIDISYRLQWAGWKCLFIPEIKVYHDRKASNLYKSTSLITRIIKARKNKAKWIKEDSFFGQQVVLIKNYSKKFSLLIKFKTLFHQWGILLFALVFEPYLLKQLKKLKKHEKEIIAKRDGMVRNVKPRSIEKFMS